MKLVWDTWRVTVMSEIRSEEQQLYEEKKLIERNILWIRQRFQGDVITLPVDAQCIQQLGPSQLSSKETHVQSHEARVGALSVCDAVISHSAHCLCFGQQAVDKVNPGATHHVDQSILRTERRGHVRVGSTERRGRVQISQLKNNIYTADIPERQQLTPNLCGLKSNFAGRIILVLTNNRSAFWGNSFSVFSIVSLTYHLQLDLDTQTLLLNGSHACGEGLPHAGGASQRQLGAALQTSDGARQNSGPTGPAHKQPTYVLSAVAED